MDRTYPTRPIAAVVAVIRRGDRFLLVRRGRPPNQGSWGFPGGVQELGETVFEAAVRELDEETGVRGCDPRTLTSLDVIERDESGRVLRHYTLVAVTLSWVEGEGAAGDDADALDWFRLEDLERLPILPQVGRIMIEALSR